MSRESTIRDNLASRLNLLETGLTLVDTEFHLPNEHGSFGFVDLVARDKLGNIVLVELKQGNAPARQAIHELYKYVALVKQNHGIPSAKLRCMIVSTTWRELLVPFSDYQRTVPYLVEGFALTVDEDCVPQSVKRIEPVPEGDSVVICPYQQLYFCVSDQIRTEVCAAITKGFAEVGLKNAILIELNYEGIYHPFPCAICLVMGKLDDAEQLRVVERDIFGAAKLARELAECADSDGWAVEAALFSNVFELLEHIEDSSTQSYNIEICYPEKLQGLLADDWSRGSVIRPGTLFASKQLYTDDEVIRWCTGIEGKNFVSYSLLTSPRFRQQWKELSDGLDFVLRSDAYLTTGFKSFLHSIEQCAPTTTLAVSTFYPVDFLSQFTMMLHSRNLRYMPSLEAFSVDEESEQLLTLSGYISWTGEPVEMSPVELIAHIFGDFQTYALKRHVHATHEDEPSVFAAMQLQWTLIQGRWHRGRSIHRTVFTADHEWQPQTSPHRSMIDFVDQNRNWCRDLLNLLHPLMGGVTGI